MQDKNLHTNKKFTDRAWLEMRTLLDEEMPVTKQKRPPIGWWIMGFMATAALLSGVYFFMFINSEKPIEETKEQKYIASTTLFSNSDKNKNIEEKIYTKTIQETNPTNEFSHAEKAINTTESVVVEKEPKAIPSIPKTFDNQMVAKNYSTKKEVVLKNTSGLAANKTSANDAVKVKSTTTNSSNKSVEQIEIASLNKLVMQNDSPVEVDPIPIVQKRKRQVVYASLLGIPHTKINGFNAGYLKQLNHNENGFTFEVGAGYAVINQPIDYIVTENYDPNGPSVGLPMMEDVFSNSIFDLNYSSSNSVRVLDSNGSYLVTTPNSYNQLQLHYITLPFQTNFHIDQWYVSAGMQTSVLLATRNKKIKGGLFNSEAASASADNGPFLLNQPFRNSSDENSILSNFDFTATVGTGFQFSDHFGIQVQYLHGIKDIIKVNNQMDHNRLLQLSARYSW